MITVDFKRLNIHPGHKILDIGSGPGRHTGAACRFFGVTAIGADISYDDIKEAKRRLLFQEQVGECRGAWALLTTDMHRLPFGDATFDLLICAEVLEHIADHQAVVREMARVLKPGGDLVVSVPRYLPEKLCWRLSKDYATSEGGHVRIYTKNALKLLLERNGTVMWAHHYAHGLHSPYWWLKCLTGPNRGDCRVVNLYHRLLVWDLMQKPLVTQWLDYLLNPVIGKSIVCYARKSC